jgi:hypothetical protein
MKKTVLKISMLIAGLIFVFTSASWADSGKKGHRKSWPEKPILAKYNGGGPNHHPVVYKHKVIQGPKHFYKKRPDRRRPAVRYKNHKFYHRNKWIQKQRQHLRHKWIHNHRRIYSDNSYEDDGAYNEFSIAATISEPGGEFSISTKRTW